MSREYPPETGGGGIGTYLWHVAPALASLGHEVHVLSCAPLVASRDYVERGVVVHRRRRSEPWWLGHLASRARLPKLITRLSAGLQVFFQYRALQRQFDVVEYPDWEAEGWVFASRRTSSLVAHVHSPVSVISRHEGLKGDVDVRLAGRVEEYSVTRAHAVTAPSTRVIDELARLRRIRTDVRIVPYAFGVDSATPPVPVESTPQTVLFLGRLQALKAPEVVVGAFRRVLARLPGASAVFVGGSAGSRGGLPYGEWLRAQASDLPNCEFRGFVPLSDVSGVIQRSRVVVVPSRYDTFPNVALEAMAGRRPVVVSSGVGLAPEVAAYGAGRVVPVGREDLFAEAIFEYLSDPQAAAAAGAGGYRYVTEELAPARIAERRVAVYHDAIERRLRARRSVVDDFRAGLPESLGTFAVPQEWRDWAVEEALEAPWKHFYIRTAALLLELLQPLRREQGGLAGLRVLDVGCTPALSVMLACMGAKVTLLDIKDQELRKGLALAEVLRVQDRVHPVRADAFRSPVLEGRFDLVWNCGFVEHFARPEGLVAQMRDCVRPDGHVAILVPNWLTPHSLVIRPWLRRTRSGYAWDSIGRERSYSPGGLRRLMARGGLRCELAVRGNLRRSVLDDVLIAAMGRWLSPDSISAAIAGVDAAESRFRWLRRFGFVVGVLGSRRPL